MEKTTTRRHSYDLHGDLEKIKNVLAATTRHAKDRATEVLLDSFEDVKERAVFAQDTVIDYIAKKPVRSVGFSMLAGVIVGYFLHRK